jgi:hypothetical protein
VRSRRLTLSWLLVLAALALSGPAAAFANGPSAGDNQYTDPLAGHHNHSGGGTHTSTTPPPATPTAASSSGASSATLSPTTPSSSASAATTTSATTAATSSSSQTLPVTGFDAALAAVIGVSLIGIGLMTRRRIRPTSR